MLLQRHVTSLGSTYSVAQKNDLLDRRRKLEARITTYEHRISVIIKLDDDTQWSTQDGKIPDMDPQPGDASDDLLELYPDGWFTPERERITLPSALAPGEIDRLSLRPLSMIEAELRKGQVADALEGLCLALGEKSLCFRTEVRNANSQRTTNRGWDNVHRLDVQARKCRSTYRHARSALQRLGFDPEYLVTLLRYYQWRPKSCRRSDRRGEIRPAIRYSALVLADWGHSWFQWPPNAGMCVVRPFKLFPQ